MNRNLIEIYAAGGQKLRTAVAWGSRTTTWSLTRAPRLVNPRAGCPPGRQR